MKTNLYSIADIAKDLGVSVSTVSRALKNHPDISKDTCEKVQAYAKSVNYRPNALALSLKQQRSNTIGLLIPEIQHHFFSSVISGIEEFAYANEFRVMICQSNEDFDREVINTQALLDHRVDGILVSIGKNTYSFDHFQNLIEHGLPVVFFDRVCEELNTDRLLTDDAGGANSITSYMLQTGRRKILHLAAPQHLHIGKERCRGYCEALHQHGVPVEEELILQCDTPDEANRLKDHILSLMPVVDAIFAVNDFTAIAVMQMLQQNGYLVPVQKAVAGFGDDPIASIVQPTLTTVQQKGFEMGIEAAQVLINRIKKPDEDLQTTVRVFPTSLKIRNST